MRHSYRFLALLILAISQAGASLPAQNFKPADNREGMDRMLQSLTLSSWADIKPGRIYHLRFDLTDAEKEVAAQEENDPPEYGILSIGFPSDYNKETVYPVLFTSVTGNIYAPNAYSIRSYYEQIQRTKWIVVSVDADHWPEHDTIIWRIAMMKAAMRFLDDRWSLFKQAPLAFGGFSGGAKISVYFAYFSTLLGKKPCGIFLGGCNYSPYREASKLTDLHRSDIQDIPVFFSMGEKDKIATIRDSRQVATSMARAGFTEQQIAVHEGGHQLDGFHLLEALQYFQSFFPVPEKKEQ